MKNAYLDHGKVCQHHLNCVSRGSYKVSHHIQYHLVQKQKELPSEYISKHDVTEI